MSNNVPKHIEGIEGDLNRYSNDLSNIPGYSEEAFNQYVSEYADYFRETGKDPKLAFAKTSLYNELGEEEYNKRGYKNYSNLDSLMNNYLGVQDSSYVMQSNGIVPVDTAYTNYMDTTARGTQAPYLPYEAVKSDEEIFGNNMITTKSFFDLHPEYRDIDLDTKIDTGLMGSSEYTFTSPSGSIQHIPRFGTQADAFTAQQDKATKERLEMIEYWASQGRSRNVTAQSLNPSVPGYDYLDFLGDIPGSNELELKYLQENPEEALEHWLKMGYDQENAEAVMHERIMKLEQEIRNKTSFALLDNERKEEIARQYELDKLLFENPSISEQESKYLFSSFNSEDSDKKNTDVLANEILDKMVNGSYFEYQNNLDGTFSPVENTVDTQKYLRMFDSLASDVSPYYADMKILGESFMPSKDKLKILSQFFAITKSKEGEEGVQEALEFLRNSLPQCEIPEMNKGLKMIRTLGQQAASTGYSIYGILEGTGRWIAGQSDAPEGSGWLDRWLWSVGTTEAVQRAQLMSDTGVFVGFGDNQDYRTALKLQRYGVNAHDLSENPVLQFIANQGFTAVTMLYSAGASGIINAGAKAAGKGVSKIAAKVAGKAATQTAKTVASKITKEVATKWAGKLLAAGILPVVTAGNEALMEGNDAYKLAVSRGEQTIDRMVSEALTGDLAMDSNGKFINSEVQEFFDSRTLEIMEEIEAITDRLSQLPGSGATEMGDVNREADVARLNQLYENLSKEYQLISQEYKETKYGDAIAKAKERIELEAVNAYASTVAIDAVIITTCDLFFSSVLGPQVGRLLKKTGMVPEKALVKWVSKTAADGVKATPYNYVTRVLGNAISEGTEEHSMVLSRTGSVELANSNLSNFFYNTTKAESEEALGYGMFANMSAVASAVGKSWVSKEAWEAFGMGALGSLFGSVNTNVTTSDRELQSHLDISNNKFEKFLAYTNAVWRTPFIYEHFEKKQHNIRANAAASYVNEAFKKNPELASAFESSKGLASYVNAFFEAKKRGDIVDMEDNEFGMFVSGANILSKLSESPIGKAYKDYIKEILKVDANSQEGQNLINNFLSKLSDEERAKYEENPNAALDEIKNRVKEFKTLQNTVNTVMTDINQTYGNLVDERTKESIAFVYLTKDNMTDRLNNREEIIKKALTNDIVLNSEVSSLTDEQKAVIAEYGSIENAKVVLENLKKNKAHRIDIKKAKKAVSIFKGIGDKNKLLSAADIFALRPVERASILSSDNLKLFSEEQQEVIKAIKRSNIDKEVFEAIEEAATIKSRLDLNDSIINKLEDSDLNLFRLNTTLIKESTIKNANTKTALLKQVDSYEEFKDGLDALIASGKLTSNEEAILGTTVFTDKKTSEFYRKYTQGKNVVKTTLDLINQMKRPATDTRTKAIVDLVLKTLAQRMSSFEDRFKFNDADNLFTEGGFLNTLKDEHSIMWDAITNEDQAKILSEVKRAIDIANIAVSNREEVMQRYVAAQPSVDINSKAEDNKVFNSTVYNKARPIFDAIFDKIVRINNGEKIQLTALEMYQLASLMNKNVFVAPLDADPILFKGLTVDVNSSKSLEKLYTALEGRKSLYEETFSTYMQFIHGLSLMIFKSRGDVLSTLKTGIVELNADYKDKLDNRKTKESQKKINKGVKFDKRAKVVSLKIIPAGSPHLTESQKEWYESNKVVDNVTTVNKRIGRQKIRTVLIKDQSLLESEYTYDNDNLPLAVAVEVGRHFPNAVKIGNRHYVYVGMCENSRNNVTEDVNILNVIRESALNDFNESEPTVITYSDTGNPVEFGGLQYNYANSDGEVITSVKEKLLRKYSNIENYEKRLEAAYNDFCKNTVEVRESVTFKTVTKEVDGITVTEEVPVVTWIYTWKGQQYEHSHDSTLEKHKSESQRSHLAYIMPNDENSKEPIINLVFNNFYEMKYTEDGDTIGLQDVYDRIIEGKMNLFDPIHANTSLSFLHNCLNDLKSETTSSKIRLDLKNNGKNKEAAWNSAAESMQESIEGIISGYLNTKPKGQTPRIRHLVSIKDGTIKVSLFNPNLSDEQALLDTVEISIEEFLKGGAAIEEFYHKVLFKTFYDTKTEKFREHKYGGELKPLVKIQVKYEKYDGSAHREKKESYDKEDKRRGVFLSGALYTDGKWASRELVNISSTVVEDKKPQQPKEVIRKGEKHRELDVPPPTKPEVTVEQAMNVLLNFKHTAKVLGEARASGHMGVTTFISTDEKKERNKMTAQEALPYDLGTSLDYVVRRYIELGRDVDKTYKFIYDSYRNLTTESKHCPIQGLNWTELREFINNIGVLVEFFENRGETVVPFDTLFTGTITSSDGKFAKLTAIPDIITIDKAGKLHIYDMKSYKAVDTSVKVPSFGPDGVFVAKGSFFNQSIGLKEDGSIDHKEGSFQKQTSLYAHVIGSATGLEVASVGIIPMPLYYDKSSTLRRTQSEIDIQGLNVFQFTVNGGDQFRLKRVPTFYGDAIKLPILPIESISSIKWSVPEEEAPIVVEDGEGDYVAPTGHEGNAEGVVPGITEGDKPKVRQLNIPREDITDDSLQKMLEECGDLGF